MLRVGEVPMGAEFMRLHVVARGTGFAPISHVNGAIAW
jgi:hypothetical protein